MWILDELLSINIIKTSIKKIGKELSSILSLMPVDTEGKPRVKIQTEAPIGTNMGKKIIPICTQTIQKYWNQRPNILFCYAFILYFKIKRQM